MQANLKTLLAPGSKPIPECTRLRVSERMSLSLPQKRWNNSHHHIGIVCGAVLGGFPNSRRPAKCSIVRGLEWPLQKI
ncbi:hypothetical protein E2C01_061616 [Portunus trituberculatus]|uniref:Uncharacterized protein n=1 Tax=Portunus trituberculatus TaxID=210409 RepID=A0A5B7H4C1_PORTR|nr:hypothetical protein [Portunus trituberculatus]